MVELRQLKYFVKIAELEHFGQAAQELHVVQPALTRQIQQLEEELDVELFERLPRGVRITFAGRVLLERSRQLLSDVDRAVAATKRAGEGKTGFVKVGFSDGATFSGHVPAIIREFRKHAPNVEVVLVNASSVEQVELLTNGAIDVGFVYWLPRDRENVESRIINKEAIVLASAVSRQLPIAKPHAIENKPIAAQKRKGAKKPLQLKDLNDVPFVWFKRESGPMYYDLVVSLCSKAGLTLNIVQEAFTESTMLSLVAADIGVTFITEAAQHRKPANVMLTPLKDMNATLTLYAIWRTQDCNPAVREFLSIARKA